MIRRPPRSTLDRSSAASDVYKRQPVGDLDTVAGGVVGVALGLVERVLLRQQAAIAIVGVGRLPLSLIHISEPTRPY